MTLSLLIFYFANNIRVFIYVFTHKEIPQRESLSKIRSHYKLVRSSSAYSLFPKSMLPSASSLTGCSCILQEATAYLTSTTQLVLGNAIPLGKTGCQTFWVTDYL